MPRRAEERGQAKLGDTEQGVTRNQRQADGVVGADVRRTQQHEAVPFLQAGGEGSGGGKRQPALDGFSGTTSGNGGIKAEDEGADIFGIGIGQEGQGAVAAVFQRLIADSATNAEVDQRHGDEHHIHHAVQDVACGPQTVGNGAGGEQGEDEDKTDETAVAVTDDAQRGVGGEVEPEDAADPGGKRGVGQGDEDGGPEDKQNGAVIAARRRVIRPGGQGGHEETDKARPGAEVQEGKCVPVQRISGVCGGEQQRQPRQEGDPGTETGEREEKAEGVFAVAQGEDGHGSHGNSWLR